MSATDDYNDAMAAQRAKYGDPSKLLDKRNAKMVTPSPDMLNKRNANPAVDAPQGVYETLSAHADKVHPVKP